MLGVPRDQCLAIAQGNERVGPAFRSYEESGTFPKIAKEHALIERFHQCFQ